ncbi:MAG: hypothetical protein ABSD44_01205 [Terracidiphilus sp.]
MKSRFAAFIAMVLLFTGCGHKKTVTVISERKLNVGQVSTCMFDGDNLYCGNVVMTVQDIEKRKTMEHIVYTVHDIVRDMKNDPLKNSESAIYPVRFDSKPIAYSIWICTYIGNADMPIKCALLKNADSKSVQEQLNNIQYVDSVLMPLTMEHLMSVCGNPQSTTTYESETTLIYPTNHPPTLANFIFRARNEPTNAVEIDNVYLGHGDDVVAGIWVPFVQDYSVVNKVEEYVPCLK